MEYIGGSSYSDIPKAMFYLLYLRGTITMTFDRVKVPG